jgi:hypothetical protein
MSTLEALIAQAEKEFKTGYFALGNGFKELHNISNDDFVGVTQHFLSLLESYSKNNSPETNQEETLIRQATEDLDYAINYITARWSHKQNSEVPKKFMLHNPLTTRWRKRLQPDNTENIIVSNAIISYLNQRDSTNTALIKIIP